jgi:hypothetical protein
MAAARGLDARTRHVRVLAEEIHPRVSVLVQIRELFHPVHRLHPPGFEIGDDTRPQVFRFADHDRVGVTAGLLGAIAHVGAADHGLDAARAELLGQLVRPRRVTRHLGGDAHQVDVEIEVDAVDRLVDERDVPVRGRVRRDHRQRQLREPQRPPLALGEPIGAVVGVRFNEEQPPLAGRDRRDRGG